MRHTLSLRARRHRPLLIALGALATVVVLFVAATKPGRSIPQVVTQAVATPAPLQVLVAAHQIAVGAVVGPTDIRLQPVSGAAPSSALFSSEAALGRIAGRSFGAGDMLLQNDLRDPASVGIAARVPQGQRAFAIRVAEDEIVGGFLQSGDHVDIFATIPGSVFPAKNAQDVPDRSQSLLLLQDVTVLAVGENLTTKGSVQANARTISLALAPTDLSRLTLALRFGKVSLAIRNPGDTVVAQATAATLLDLVPPPTRAPAARSRPVAGIPFYSGTRMTSARAQ